MTKTIENLAKQYAEDMCPIGDYCGGVYDEQRNSDLPIYTDDAKSVLEWLFAKSLASRLTADEKEKIKGYYSETQGWLDEKRSFDNPNEYLRICAVAIQDRLESIFGKELFERKEEE